MNDLRATRPSLLIRIRDAADTPSWLAFVELYSPLIRGYCMRRGLQEADACDVAQEVLAQVSRSIRTFEYEPGRGRFRDWLGTITRNKIARHVAVRARGDQPVGGGPSADLIESVSSPEADTLWSSAFHDRVLQVALARSRVDFEPTTWAAFEGVWLDARPAAELAHSLGLKIEAVYAAKSRVLRRLREEVLALAEDLPTLIPSR